LMKSSQWSKSKTPPKNVPVPSVVAASPQVPFFPSRTGSPSFLPLFLHIVLPSFLHIVLPSLMSAFLPSFI
jgi:hypothetical protein